MSGSLVVTSLSDQKVVLDWVSENGGDDAGKVSAGIMSTYKAAFSASAYLPLKDEISGYIVGIETIPGLNGDKTTDCPTALYDITLDDSYGYALAGGSLANRSASVAEKVVPSQPIPIDSEITVSISAAGNSKKGRIIIHIKPEK